jgi:predicted enzyme related to lactoylglutathione lyase
MEGHEVPLRALSHVLPPGSVMRQFRRTDQPENEDAAVTEGMKTIIYPVKDLAKAKAVFRALLGAEPQVDEPYYVGFAAGGQHVGLDPNGHAKGMAGPVGYWHVDDIHAALKGLTGAGAETVQAPTDVGGGRLVATVKDADGNPIGLLQDPKGG